jgi:hypothetical protein
MGSGDMDKYGWRDATKAEVEDLAKRMDLVKVFHSVADTSLWYRREEAESCTSYMDCTTYARREELYNYEHPERGFQINQRNLDAWDKR